MTPADYLLRETRVLAYTRWIEDAQRRLASRPTPNLPPQDKPSAAQIRRHLLSEI